MSDQQTTEIEVTPEMIDAAILALTGRTFHEFDGSRENFAREATVIYRAMEAARAK